VLLLSFHPHSASRKRQKGLILASATHQWPARASVEASHGPRRSAKQYGEEEYRKILRHMSRNAALITGNGVKIAGTADVLPGTNGT
jgi:hypothetical protein